VAAAAPQPTVQAQGGLIQMRLLVEDIPTTVTCSDCHCTYNRANEMDSRLHREEHDLFVLGVPVTGLRPTSSFRVERLWSSSPNGLGDYIVTVDRSSHNAWKNLASTVLDLVDRDLGAEPINPNRLWSTTPERSNSSRGARANNNSNLVARFKVYLYVKDMGRFRPKRVVSLLLAERIAEGFETVYAQGELDESATQLTVANNTQLQVTDRAHEAVLGVNKIWTHQEYRGQNCATRLIDKARDNFIWSYRIPRIHVAWTQTTEDGARFAERYFQSYGDFVFLTYFEDL